MVGDVSKSIWGTRKRRPDKVRNSEKVSLTEKVYLSHSYRSISAFVTAIFVAGHRTSSNSSPNMTLFSTEHQSRRFTFAAALTTGLTRNRAACGPPSDPNILYMDHAT